MPNTSLLIARFCKKQRTCTVVATDDAPEPQWKDVHIDTVEESFVLRVEIERSVETVHATDNARMIAYPQFGVVASDKERKITLRSSSQR